MFIILKPHLCRDKQLRHELGHRPDKQQDSIILSYIELILNYAKRFYDRQFMTRRQDNNDILARFEKLLDDYYNNGKQLSNGIPSVLYYAEQLCMSSNYFGDLVLYIHSMLRYDLPALHRETPLNICISRVFQAHYRQHF